MPILNRDIQAYPPLQLDGESIRRAILSDMQLLFTWTNVIIGYSIQRNQRGRGYDAEELDQYMEYSKTITLF